ncbi:methyltransferase domain-containing protein [Patescibacteria group bacterium]|nr:methyltransferase domain-containing protein [Patescibacteria group bacterium]
MTYKQPISAKRGEIRFRDKLSDQHFGTKTAFPQEYTSQEMIRVLVEKTRRVREDFAKLNREGVALSPFLDIGAGYGQASLLLENEFSAQGFASDLASKPLLTMNESAKRLGFSRLPHAVVFDAESIPFPNQSFAFVFCYQTLHHFPHPLAVTREIARVLKPGGVFFFAEEPVAQSFNLPLWHRPTKLRWWEKALKATLILPFISRIGKTEIDHGILEEAFPLSVWKEALTPFAKFETELKPFPFGPKGSLERNNGLNRLFLFFLGGGITGVARKKASQAKPTKPHFACPTCRRHPRLSKKNGALICPNCGDTFPVTDSIPILIKKKLRKKLYG